MSLLNNYTVLNSNPGREIGGFTNLYSNYKPSKWYSFYDPDTTTTRLNAKACFASGTEPPYSWILAPSGGELSSTTLITGTGAITANMSLIFSLASTMGGVGTLVADAKLFLTLASVLAGTGGLTANLKGIASLAASIVVNEGAATVASIATGVWSDTATYLAGTKGKLQQDSLSTNKFLALK